MSHAASGVAWNTVAGDPLDTDGAHYELFFGYRDEAAFAAQVEQLVADRFASRLAAKDHTLWGPAAEDESAKRLGWVDLSRTSQPLVAQVAALREELHGQGLTRIVLCGMGGSSLAPEVICGAAGVELDVLDSSDPDFVRTAIDNDLAHTVVVVSSKSGGTVETDSQRRAYEKAFSDAGIDARERIIVVTDPGSPLDQSATEAGYRVFRADPTVGGRFSALTAFGLVPSGLAGADIGALLAEAEAIRGVLEQDSVDNPGLRLGALIGVANLAGVDKLVLCNAEAPYAGFGDWAEQLVAESTGKDGKGVLPVIVESPTAPELLPQHPRRGARQLRPGLALRRRAHQVGLGCQRRRAPGGAAVAVGARHRGVRRHHRHQPLRPARRRERQGRCPRPARRRRRPAGAEVHRRRDHRLRLSRCRHPRRVDRARRDRRAARPARPRPRLRRRPGLPRPSSRRRPGRRTHDHRRRDRPSRHLRLGSALPPLDRAVPQGRPVHRRLPPGHQPARARPRGARPSVHLPRVPHRPGSRRRPGARREGPTGAAAAPRRARPHLDAVRQALQ